MGKCQEKIFGCSWEMLATITSDEEDCGRRNIGGSLWVKFVNPITGGGEADSSKREMQDNSNTMGGGALLCLWEASSSFACSMEQHCTTFGSVVVKSRYAKSASYCSKPKWP